MVTAYLEIIAHVNVTARMILTVFQRQDYVQMDVRRDGKDNRATQVQICALIYYFAKNIPLLPNQWNI